MAQTTHLASFGHVLVVATQTIPPRYSETLIDYLEFFKKTGKNKRKTYMCHLGPFMFPN